MQQKETALLCRVRMERRGKSSPAHPRGCGPVNPIRCNTDWDGFAGPAVPTGGGERAGRPGAKIDYDTRQNSAYRLSRQDFSCCFHKLRVDKFFCLCYYILARERTEACRFWFVPYAPVAQLDRVFGYEPKGRRFESCRAYQKSTSTVRGLSIFYLFTLH